MRTIHRLTLSLALAAATLAASAQKPAPSPTATITPSASTAAPHNWNSEQILTCTVAQCWQLANRDESTFFDIIQQLAAVSAQNRGITLPDDAAAGQRVGNYIKMKTKEDHQVLLYAIVDAAIRHVGDKTAAAAAAK
jgi:hypothetical protein